MTTLDLTLAALASCLPLGVLLAYLTGRAHRRTRRPSRESFTCRACRATFPVPFSIDQAREHFESCRGDSTPTTHPSAGLVEHWPNDRNINDDDDASNNIVRLARDAVDGRRPAD